MLHVTVTLYCCNIFKFGFQRGFEYVNKPEIVDMDFIVVDSTETAEVPFH